jgi:PAS domain S-box-containing protein
MPVVVSPPFLITICAIAIELSRDVLHATTLARDLRESQQRLDLAASAAGFGMWVWDVARNQTWATDEARTLLGVRKDEVLDFDRWSASVHPQDAAAVRQTVAQALAKGDRFAAEYRVKRSDGTTRWIVAQGSAEADANGRPAVVRGIFRDVTESKLAQSESEELRRDLAHAGRVTMLGQLASALAHELSQPLGAILRNAEAAEMLLQEPDPDLEELREIVTDIHKDDRRAGEVIDRLRALLERRKVELQPVEVEPLVQDVLSLLRSDALARHVTLDYALEPNLPSVLGDKVHLSQVLLNLIMNGMDALNGSPCNGRRVVVEARHGLGKMIELAVADSGHGIPAEVVERVLDPFFTTKSTGMGMGLPISRTIVEAHGGRMWADNGNGTGATFRFSLPVADGAAP